MTALLTEARKLEEQLRSMGDCHLLRTPTRTLGTRAIADTIRDLCAEVGRLERANASLIPGAIPIATEIGCLLAERDGARQERDAALARVKELTALIAKLDPPDFG